MLGRFLSLRGFPEKVYTVCQIQLLAVDQELMDAVKGFDQNHLLQHRVDKGNKQVFTSSDGHWRNDCSEALIKSLKETIKIIVGEETLSSSELQAVCFEAGNLVNERSTG